MTKRLSAEIVQSWGLWHFLTALEKNTLLQSARVHSLPRFHVLFDEYEEGCFLHILLSGRLKITKTGAHDKQIVMYLMRDEEVIGCHLLDQPGLYGYSATTIDTSLVLSLRLDVFRSIIRENRALCREFSRLVLNRLQKIEDKMLTYLSNRSEQRVRFFLKEMAKYDSRDIVTGDIEIKFPLSKALIGEMSGTSRQQVTNLLKNMEKTGLLQYKRQRIVIYRLDLL